MLLIAWLVVGALPELFSNEGIPHALRAMLVLPAAVLLAAWGGERICAWLYSKNVSRALMTTLIALLVFVLLIQGYYHSFIVWGTNQNVRDAFTKKYTEITEVLNELPRTLPKYVVVSAHGTLVNGIPVPAETVMFLTDTYSTATQEAKNIHYLLPSQTNQIPKEAFTVNLE